MTGKLTKIALGGPKFCGKDTVADVFVEKYNFTVFSFSDQLKKIAIDLYPFMKYDYPSDDKETLIVYTNLDTGVELTPRDVWQSLDALPDTYPEIFVNMMEQQVKNFLDTVRQHEMADDIRILIKDVRRPAEIRYAKRFGYHNIYIDTDDPRSFNKAAEHKSESFQEEVKAAADVVYFNSKKDRYWDVKLEGFVDSEAERFELTEVQRKTLVDEWQNCKENS